MIKHCKYSKNREVKPYKVTVISHRYDGNLIDEYFFNAKETALKFIETLKYIEPKTNEYFFGNEYKIEYIGTDKYI